MSDSLGALALPQELLVKLFSYLEQKQLGLLSTVSRCWRDAALMALKSLHLEITEYSSEQLPCWLKHRSQHLQHVQLTHELPILPIQLPFTSIAQLRSLVLERGKIYSATCKALSRLQSSLMSLHLCAVEADSYSELLSSIAVLGRLQSLTIVDCSWDSDMKGEERRIFAVAANSVWCNLSHLTTVTFAGCHADDMAVREITRLTNLQHLDLNNGQISKPATLASLPESLTYLDLAHNHRRLDFSDILAQSPLPALKQVIIDGITMSSPIQLSALTKLEGLSMSFATVHQAHQLLSVLPQLSSLRQLQLAGLFGYTTGEGLAAAGGILTHHLDGALQLPQLTALRFEENQIIPPLPGASDQTAAPMLFYGWHLPELLELNLAVTRLSTAEEQVLCRAQELSLLAQKFPKLCHLDLTNRVHPTLSAKGLHPLQQLTDLTYLSIGGGDHCWQLDDAALKAIAVLTSLKQLWLWGASAVTDLGLASLTKLTQLTALDVCGLQANKLSNNVVSGRKSHLKFVLQGSKQVWQQLSHRLRDSVDFLQERQKELEKELKAAKKEAAYERKRAAAAQQQASAAEKELAALQQQFEKFRAAAGCDGAVEACDA